MKNLPQLTEILGNLFHTRLELALRDPSFWPSLSGIVIASYALDGAPRYISLVCGFIGIILKDRNTENDQ